MIPLVLKTNHGYFSFMIGSQDGIYPLFPLEVVLYPNMPLPLHIFESRYRHLVQDCIEKNIEFGVILQRNGKTSQIGTLAKIENILERFPDGRMNIITLGKKRFCLECLVEGKDYFQGRIKILEDLPDPPQDLAQFRQKGESLLNQLAELTGLHTEAENFSSFTCATFSFLLSEVNGFNLLQQQQVLELPSASLRYSRVLVALEHLVEKHRMIKDLKEPLIGFSGSSNKFLISHYGAPLLRL